jgi:hypothetical protein
LRQFTPFPLKNEANPVSVSYTIGVSEKNKKLNSDILQVKKRDLHFDKFEKNQQLYHHVERCYHPPSDNKIM